ncbi:MAG: nucleotidyl transferase AbiEii/AbiGii toxin family protein [Bacillota bacterium]|nr:nucleotidyl transferase AbiEii/AbiGii toxin family protein [Bacillota bacterium]
MDLERLSKSKYKDNFILKGGILIAALVGIDYRATMDIDATVKNYPINIESLTKVINEIFSIVINDNVSFTFSGLSRKSGNYLET